MIFIGSTGILTIRRPVTTAILSFPLENRYQVSEHTKMAKGACHRPFCWRVGPNKYDRSSVKPMLLLWVQAISFKTPQLGPSLSESLPNLDGIKFSHN